MSHRLSYSILAACWLVVLARPPVAGAQTGPTMHRPAHSVAISSFDRTLLYGVYHQESPLVRSFYRGVDASSWPLFVGGPVVAWVGAWWIGKGTDWDEAYRLTLSSLFTTLSVQILKNGITRYRPYVVLDDIVSRSKHHGDFPREVDRESFPSGHAAQAFALATSISLSYPRWFVIAPAALWASGVALSRPWLGVHFPSDVLVGAAIGAGFAVLIHVLDPYITPKSLLDRELQPAGRTMVHLRFRL